MKTILTTLAIVCSSAFAMAQDCPQFAGVYTSGGETLTITQPSCSQIKFSINDGYLTDALAEEYFPSQGEYQDARYPESYNALRSDVFENGQLVSMTRYTSPGSHLENKIKMQVGFNSGSNQLVVQHFQAKGGQWVPTQTWIWFKAN
ncbi:MAG: hypothetical protein FMNOHCHN_03601 [Ignavibacteriaceae bacterium]|nr:hypothetical protein [Ignavibacteriaceae bacterium]GIL17945.1 MAG: hypothetical protein BroJett040_16960 [Oligoflexia bacterium]